MQLPNYYEPIVGFDADDKLFLQGKALGTDKEPYCDDWADRKKYGWAIEYYDLPLFFFLVHYLLSDAPRMNELARRANGNS